MGAPRDPPPPSPHPDRVNLVQLQQIASHWHEAYNHHISIAKPNIHLVMLVSTSFISEMFQSVSQYVLDLLLSLTITPTWECPTLIQPIPASSKNYKNVGTKSNILSTPR
jgi:hypothetical protein